MMSGKMKLTYFNARGRVEMTRLLFNLAGKEFIDNRVDGESWAALKPHTPKGEIPVLEVDGKMMCESVSIARFVAREYGLYGSCNWESAIVDMVVDSNIAVFTEMFAYLKKAKSEEEKAEGLKKITDAYELMEKLVVSLKKGQFILGDKASMADTVIYDIIHMSQQLTPGIKYDTLPTLMEVHKSFSELPAIAKWIKTRPVTPY